jgi:hypothetical protein
MDDAKRYGVNQGKAAGKVIDGEAIIINAVTGRYYSLDESACVAWVHLAAGSAPSAAVAAILARYEVDEEVVRRDLEALVERLVAEDLLLEDPPGHNGTSVDESGLHAPGGERRPYATMELVTFTDMEDLLAFDPPLPAVEPHEWEWHTE